MLQSSSPRTARRQERGRLDLTRHAQSNQTGAPSGSTSAGAVDAQMRLDRPIRPSEMKGEECVSCLIPPVSIVLYGKGGMCPCYPVVVSMDDCVNYIAVVSTRTSLPLLHAFARYHGKLGRP